MHLLLNLSQEDLKIKNMISPSKFTLKKALVDPDSKQPYLILVCFARSSADSIGDSIRSTTTRTGLGIYE